MGYDQDLNRLDRLVHPDPGGALHILRQMDARHDAHPAWGRARAALLIDIGDQLHNKDLVTEGLNAVAELDPDWQSCYWMGNGYQLLHELSQAESFDPRNTTLPLAKAAYRDAIARFDSKVSAEFSAQVWTNYGNTLSRKSGIGRNLEAIDAYRSALKLNPDFGMALGNLAIEMDDFVWVSRTHGFLEEALVCAGRALASPDLEYHGGPEASSAFENAHARIERHLSAWRAAEARAERSRADRPSERSSAETGPSNPVVLGYQRWCAANGLFLDFSIAPAASGLSRTDSLLFRSMGGDAEVVLPLFRLLNEIKEAFATARWLFYQACVPALDYSEIDAATAFVFNTDYGVYGVRVGTLKAAFQLCYDILDKLGLCLYRRLKLTKPRKVRGVDFHSIWGKPSLSDEMADLIAADSSRFLYALYDVSRDLDCKTGYHHRLREIRNSLTHTYLLPHVELGGWHEDWDRADYHAYLPDLKRTTFQLFALVRATIVYFVCLVDHQERPSSLDQQGVPTIRTDLQTYDSKLFGHLGWSDA